MIYTLIMTEMDSLKTLDGFHQMMDYSFMILTRMVKLIQDKSYGGIIQ